MRLFPLCRASALAIVFGAMASACSGSNSNNADADGGPGGPTPFQPAQPVDDACSLLTTADVATLLPSTEIGRSDMGVTNADAWLRKCYWDSPGQLASTMLLPSVSLTVAGALTGGGADSLARPSSFDSTGGTREALQGVGDEAIYFDIPLPEVGVFASYGNYSVEFYADSFQSPPSKDSIVALVKKVIGQLH